MKLKITILLALIIFKTTVSKENNLQAWVKEGIKTAVLTYGSQFTNTLTHELGHALTARLLFNSPIQIFLGANSKDIKTRKSFNNFIKIINFKNIGNGFCISHIPLSTPKYKRFLELLMGPICGVIHAYACLKIFMKIKK